MEADDLKTRQLHDLVETKPFEALDPSERALVLRELGSEREYNILRKISLALVSEKAGLSPDPRTLTTLKKRMNSRTKSAAVSIFSYPVPAYAMAVVAILLVAGFYVLSNATSVERKVETVAHVRIDTVFIPSVPDTVFVDRVVVKYITAPAAPADDFSLVKNLKDQESKTTTGVSMKDKEELEDFLVSGS